MKIVVSSQNPVKIETCKEAFEMCFLNEEINVTSVTVNSGVSDQPMTEEETIIGARNRAENAKALVPDAQYWIGLEGGIEEVDKDLIAFAWVVIVSKEKIGKGKTASYFLPKKVTELIKQGKELGDADDIVFGRTNSKQQNGATGILTHDVITRKELYKQAVVLALIPFMNKELY